jgi:hypothetical protein
MESLTQEHISTIWNNSGSRKITSEERRGMTLMAAALALATKNEPKVFACPDGILLKVERYNPDPFSSEHAQRMMNDKFVIAAINQAFDNGRASAKVFPV